MTPPQATGEAPYIVPIRVKRRPYRIYREHILSIAFPPSFNYIQSTDNYPIISFMKCLVILFLSLCFTSVRVTAQHPLVGTWEMISVKGIDADGEPFFDDTSSVRETKIITPTHYILIAWDVDKDSLTFNRTMAGQVRLENEKYIEIPTHASVQIFENVEANFTWKLEGDIFTQSGTIRRPDGKIVVLEALIFKRLKDIRAGKDNPAIGTWHQVSGSFTTPDGKNQSTFNPGDTRLLVVTPTHWMRMDLRNKKFDGVQYGTYTSQADNIVSHMEFSTYPFQTGDRHQFTQKVNGDRLHITSSGRTPQGQSATFHDIFEKQ